MHLYRKCWFDLFKEQFISLFWPIDGHWCLEMPFIVYSILKQCWSVGYVSLLTLSFINLQSWDYNRELYRPRRKCISKEVGWWTKWIPPLGTKKCLTKQENQTGHACIVRHTVHSFILIFFNMLKSWFYSIERQRRTKPPTWMTE